MKLSLHPNGSLRYRSVSARTRRRGCGRTKDGQPALSPPCPAKPAGLRAPLTAPGKRVRVTTGEKDGGDCRPERGIDLTGITQLVL